MISETRLVRPLVGTGMVAVNTHNPSRYALPTCVSDPSFGWILFYDTKKPSAHCVTATPTDYFPEFSTKPPASTVNSTLVKSGVHLPIDFRNQFQSMGVYVRRITILYHFWGPMYPINDGLFLAHFSKIRMSFHTLYTSYLSTHFHTHANLAYNMISSNLETMKVCGTLNVLIKLFINP